MARFNKGKQDGLVLSDATVYLIFWGQYWTAAQGKDPKAQVKNAADSMLNNANYLAALKDEYGLKNVSYGGDVSDMDTEPPNPFTDTDVKNEINKMFGKGLPPPPAAPKYNLYVVIMPHGATAGPGQDEGGFGAHRFDHYSRLYYAWVLSGRAKAIDERISSSLSEEIVETITDPEPPTGWITHDADGTVEELCDVCEGINYELPGKVVVKTYYSNAKEDCFPPLEENITVEAHAAS